MLGERDDNGVHSDAPPDTLSINCTAELPARR